MMRIIEISTRVDQIIMGTFPPRGWAAQTAHPGGWAEHPFLLYKLVNINMSSISIMSDK